ncbi:MAG TPA: RNA polymerase sigma-70 factor [Actinomycetota bacterium]|nr:RNA polymerase sigma-70 factor [Actinomycetota bacterium]
MTGNGSGVVRADEEFVELRPLLFSIAYRMLGSITEAEDVVQDAFLRWHHAAEEGAAVDSAKSYLAATVTRLAIDTLRRAKTRRETYIGPWLPEPLVAGTEDDVAEQAEMADSLSMAFLVLLESLKPVERAVFLLREVFEYDYAEIAEVVGKSEPNTRQIFIRARQRIEAGTPRFEPSSEERDELAQRFFAACTDGDMDGLLELLAADSVAVGDGGGKVYAARAPIHGAQRVATFLVRLFDQGRRVGARLELTRVNGQPGALAYDREGLLLTVLSLDVVDARVQAIRSVANPDKLGHLGSISSYGRRDPVE